MIGDDDARFMTRALELAEGGRLGAHPNPMVGCVIARGGEALGEGFHELYGELHAEAAALADCRGRGHDPEGATAYATLEPCAHQGKQPPCTEALIAARVSRVVIASEDPSVHAAGAGPQALLAAGIEVAAAAGGLAREARLLNQPFRKHALTGLPHVILKQAFTAGGALVAEDSRERWVSGPESRALVHSWRAEADAVCVGVGTVLADDPALTVRDAEFVRQPARVVFDSLARTPVDSNLVRTIEEAPLHVLVTGNANAAAVARLQDAGAMVRDIPDGTPAERVRAGLGVLGALGITGTLFEPGATLAAALAEADEIDELRTFHAGGPPAGAADPEGAVWVRSGQDQLMTARLRVW